MTEDAEFRRELESKVAKQLKAQRVGYLLGAGSSYLGGAGYPLAFQLWDLIKDGITDTKCRGAIQSKLDRGAAGLEQALDLLDDGGAKDTPYRHVVTEAIAELFLAKNPDLTLHVEFVRRLYRRASPSVKVFSLNYDPLVERAAEDARIRFADGFSGVEHAYFEPALFEERIGRIRGSYKARQFDETVKPIHLLKLHGSLGWYQCPQRGVRRCGFELSLPKGTRRLMVPPQRRKANDTTLPPYSALWTAFRGCLVHNAIPINRLVCLGYGFGDEHVNDVIEAAMARTDFTLLLFTKALPDRAWARWSAKRNAIVVTEKRCAIKGAIGPGHHNLWSFEQLCKEV